MRTLDAVSCYIYRAMCACFWILWGKEDKDTSASNAKMLGPRTPNLASPTTPKRSYGVWGLGESSETKNSLQVEMDLVPVVPHAWLRSHAQVPIITAFAGLVEAE